MFLSTPEKRAHSLVFVSLLYVDTQTICTYRQKTVSKVVLSMIFRFLRNIYLKERKV